MRISDWSSDVCSSDLVLSADGNATTENDMKRPFIALCVAAMLAGSATAAAAPAESGRRAVLETYADIAHAGYADSLAAAKALQAAVNDLVEHPSAAAMAAARHAWPAARVPYTPTEPYRFGHSIVDGWEAEGTPLPLH